MDYAAIASRLVRFEGSTDYMYLCTGGEVTVGVGHAVFSESYACALKWRGTPAAAIVTEDWTRVKAATMGLAASQYRNLTQCRMDAGDIDKLLDADIAAVEKQLSLRLPVWEKYPESAREALFDMAFNLGLMGLLKYYKMLVACGRGDWTIAAQESWRHGISDERNHETAALFNACSVAAWGKNL